MPATTFAETLATAIAERGLGLERLARHVRDRGLPCSAATLSLWQNGRSRPRRSDSLRVLVVLEDLLGLEPGTLLEAAGRPEPGDAGWWSTAVDPQQVFGDGDVVARLRSEWGIPDPSPLQREYLQETLLVRDRRRVGLEVTQVLRASHSGQHRLLAVYTDNSPTESSEPGVWRTRALGGARVWRRAEFLDRRMSVTALQLDRWVRAGELAVIRYVVEPSTPEALDDDVWHDHALTPLSPVQRLSLAVVFEGETPRRVQSAKVQVEEGVPRAIAWTALSPDVPADVSAVGVLGGGISIRWSWEGDA